MEARVHLKRIRTAMFNLALDIVEHKVPNNEIEFRSRVLNQQLIYWEGKMKEANESESRHFLFLAMNDDKKSPWGSHIGTFAGALRKAKALLAEWRPTYRNGDGSKIVIKDMVTRREFTFTI